jgi:hypothetical protein
MGLWIPRSSIETRVLMWVHQFKFGCTCLHTTARTWLIGLRLWQVNIMRSVGEQKGRRDLGWCCVDDTYVSYPGD